MKRISIVFNGFNFQGLLNEKDYNYYFSIKESISKEDVGEMISKILNIEIYEIPINVHWIADEK